MRKTDAPLRKAGSLMVAPAVEGIDLFKIAGRSISGWIPSLTCFALEGLEQRLLRTREERGGCMSKPLIGILVGIVGCGAIFCAVCLLEQTRGKGLSAPT